MSIDDIHEQTQALLADTAASYEIAELLPLAEIPPLVARRLRRRQMFGGLATVLLVVIVVVGAGLAGHDATPSAVFAGDAHQSLVPSTVVIDGDRYVGLAVVSTVQGPTTKDVSSVVVESTDGKRWTRVAGSPIIGANGLILGEWQGVFHIVGTRRIEFFRDGREEIERELFHATSTDLIDWQDSVHDIPDGLDADDFHTTPVDIAFADSSVVVLLSHVSRVEEIEAAIESHTLTGQSVCELTSTDSRTTLRVCGETDPIYIPRPQGSTFKFEHVLATLRDDTLEVIDLEASDSFISPFAYSASLYQTFEGVGVSSLEVFESTDGLRWEVVDTGPGPGVLMAVQGAERVFKTAVQIDRFGADDPVTGMGYSSDGGTSWSDVRIDDLFLGAEEGRRVFSGLTATDAGWLLMAQRFLEIRPEVQGVERETAGSSSFAITVDGYTLEGQTPFGAAELRDPSGQLVRSWEQLEVANPVWSGFEVIDGDFTISAAEDGSKLVTITSEQWSALIDPLGFNISELLFSKDGTNWSIIDSSTSQSRILVARHDEVLVQRSAPGNYSFTVPPVDVVRLPVADGE